MNIDKDSPHSFATIVPVGKFFSQVLRHIRRNEMGDKGGKKDKNKADKQKHEQVEKKKEQDKAKLPVKRPA